MAYWKNITDDQMQGLAEAAIASAHQTLVEARARANTKAPMQAYEHSYIEAFRNMRVLIPRVPASDVLRAEQMAFRLVELTKYVNHRPQSNDLSLAQAVLEAVQETPAYRALLVH